jgi:hypothetical protein
MRRALFAFFFLFAATPAIAQSVPQRMWEEVGRKFGELIRHKGMNCPEGKLAVPKGEDAYGKVYQVFCGQVGVSPLSGAGGGLVAFRLTFKPNNDFIVLPWFD